MGLLSLKRRQKQEPASQIAAVQSERELDKRYELTECPPSAFERRLYSSLRQCRPVVDAAIGKLVRLTGGFEVRSESKQVEWQLREFLQGIRVGLSNRGVHAFLDSFLSSLLTYGNAAGEILLSRFSGRVEGLINVSADKLIVKPGSSPVDARYYVGKGDEEVLLPYPQLILFSALNPPDGSPYGVSVLRGLPAISNILLRIYECIGQNFDRVGNIRYAVTYKPSNDSTDKAYAKERAMQIAKEWSEGMAAARCGNIKDFVAVGDVSIKVIGAENQLIDTQVPVRQLLEQIVAKLGIPPFLLGLNWTTTERMSKQQVDILTSELEFYRRLLNPIIMRICRAFLASIGSCEEVEIEWQNINLQDEVELANARLSRAKAQEIEQRLERGE